MVQMNIVRFHGHITLNYCKHVSIVNYELQIEKFFKRILKICKNSLKDIVIVINCCWQSKRFSYSIVNKYFLTSTKTILVIVIV